MKKRSITALTFTVVAGCSSFGTGPGSSSSSPTLDGGNPSEEGGVVDPMPDGGLLEEAGTGRFCDTKSTAYRCFDFDGRGTTAEPWSFVVGEGVSLQKQQADTFSKPGAMRCEMNKDISDGANACWFEVSDMAVLTMVRVDLMVKLAMRGSGSSAVLSIAQAPREIIIYADESSVFVKQISTEGQVSANFAGNPSTGPLSREAWTHLEIEADVVPPQRIRVKMDGVLALDIAGSYPLTPIPTDIRIGMRQVFNSNGTTRRFFYDNIAIFNN